jgi:hypothetical protein
VIRRLLTSPWPFWCTGTAAIAMAFGLAVLGQWGSAAVAIALAAWIGAHPTLQRGWYHMGYVDGFDGARTCPLCQKWMYTTCPEHGGDE